VDLMASLAVLTGQKPPEDAGPDSFNTLSALLGDSPRGREHVVEHAGSLALRKGKWKLIEPNKGARVLQNTHTETGNSPEPQLYDVSADPGESRNVEAENSGVVQELTALLQKIRNDGKSRP
jgi:hypothetical protein